MHINNILLILISISFLTFCGTFIMKRFLISKGLLVIPNLRSSHKKPKPQGGGLAVIIFLTLSLFFLNILGLIEIDQFLFFLVPGLFVAFIGFLDDFIGINPLIRLSVHFFSAFIGLYIIGTFPIISFYDQEFDLGIVGLGIGLLYVVWMTNLYNFMDGIDGFVSLEAISVLCCFSFISYFVFSDPTFSFLLAVICSTIFGFLLLNFPKSQIFLGDVGSCFLGIITALISIHSSQNNPELFWSWLILLGFFIVDSTFTLFIRVFRKEKFYLPHSLHAYQKLTRKLKSHTKTSILLVCVNLFWLAPIAFLVALARIEGVSAILIAYAPLIILVYKLKAGIPDKQNT